MHKEQAANVTGTSKGTGTAAVAAAAAVVTFIGILRREPLHSKSWLGLGTARLIAAQSEGGEGGKAGWAAAKACYHRALQPPNDPDALQCDTLLQIIQRENDSGPLPSSLHSLWHKGLFSFGNSF
jgi:hypothetical protein